MKLVIFDLAGTTLHASEQVAGAFVSTLAQHSIFRTEEEIARVRGASKREAFRRLIPPGPDRERMTEVVYSSFRKELLRLYQTEGVSAVAGAEDVFENLRVRDIRIALNTGFDREIVHALFHFVNWSDRLFDAVVCGDDVLHGRPAPYLIFHAMERTAIMDVRQVVNVGDTDLDLAAGHNAGVAWNVGVLSGAHDRSRLERAPHTHLFESITEFYRELEPHL